MSNIEDEINELIDDRLVDKEYLDRESVSDMIEEAIGYIDFDDKVQEVVDNVDIEDKVQDAVDNIDIDEKIEYVIDNYDFDDKVQEVVDNIDIEDKVQDAVDNIYFDDKIQDAVVKCIEEGSINTATSQNGDSAFPPQGNISFLKGALVCLTRYVESIESVGEEE